MTNCVFVKVDNIENQKYFFFHDYRLTESRLKKLGNAISEIKADIELDKNTKIFPKLLFQNAIKKLISEEKINLFSASKLICKILWPSQDIIEYFFEKDNFENIENTKELHEINKNDEVIYLTEFSEPTNDNNQSYRGFYIIEKPLCENIVNLLNEQLISIEKEMIKLKGASNEENKRKITRFEFDKKTFPELRYTDAVIELLKDNKISLFYALQLFLKILWTTDDMYDHYKSKN